MATEALGFELETGVLEALVAASRYAFLDRHVGLVDGHVWERALCPAGSLAHATYFQPSSLVTSVKGRMGSPI